MSLTTPNSTTDVTGFDVLTSVQATPTASGNVANRNAIFQDSSGAVWAVDANGDAIKTGSSAVANTKPDAAITDLQSLPPETSGLYGGENYIVTATATGAWAGKEGKIAMWDAVNSVWTFETPTNGDKATVLSGANTGVWQYSSTTNTWTQTSTSAVEIPTPSLTVAAGNIKLPSVPTMMYGYRADTPVGVIQNRSTWMWGDDVNLNPGDSSATTSLPRQVAVAYNNLVDGSWANYASSYPEFVDMAWVNDAALAIDGNGKVWASGSVASGLGFTTTPTGTTATTIQPNYGWYMVPFFSTITDKVAKVYMPSYVSSGGTHSLVITQNGDGYITGANGNGQLGLGDTTARANWVKFPLTNLKYAILGQGFTLVVRANGDVYFAGNDAGGFSGAVATRTSPVLLATGAATYEKSVAVAPTSGPQTVWVVKADGTLFAGGANNQGQQGRGTTTAVTGMTQVPGVTNAKLLSTNPASSNGIAMIRTDNTLSVAGYNTNGRLAVAANTTDSVNTTFSNPVGTFQGYVADVLQGYYVSLLRTNTGDVYAAGNDGFSGIGRGGSGNWVNYNRFSKLALPNPVVGWFGAIENANVWDGFILLTNIGSLYGFGSPMITKYTSGSQRAMSPMRIPMWGDTGVTTLASLPMAADVVGSFSGATAASVTNIVDGGSNQTVTFTVNYTGGVFGTVSLAGSTVTGADITQVSLTTTSVVVQAGSGTFTVSFVINAADIAALVPPNTQAQAYEVTLLVNGS